MENKVKDLVSIITPTYNCGEFIEDTIKSVLSQTYENWEMIIVDDCSTDDTKQIVEKYRENRIKYHRLSKNSGAAVARNKALAMAKGKWIAFLDSDDLWESTKLEEQLNYMVCNNYYFTYTPYNTIDEKGNPRGKIVSGPKCISRLGMLCYCWPGCLTVMYNRECIGEVKISDIKKNNDYAIWLIVSKKACCYKYDSVLAHYRIRKDSISHVNYTNLIKWHYKLFRQVEHAGVFVSLLLTLNNIIWGIYKKIKYQKSI